MINGQEALTSSCIYVLEEVPSSDNSVAKIVVVIQD